MKLSAPQTLKFMKLKRRLGIPHWQCVGLLESLWLFTQRNAPDGAIGKHSDEDIAAAIEWDGTPSELIKNLTECGWLDECQTNRITVHDWEDHAPSYLKGAMSKNGIDFAKTTPAKQGAKQPAKQGAKQNVKQPAKHPGRQPAPYQTLPNHTFPNLPLPSDDGSEPAKAVEQKPAKPRERNPLFDAIAEVCGLDPKTAGGLIGSVVKTLSAAEPPYTPEDVRQFFARFAEFCSWASKDTPPRQRPTPKEVERYIGKLRAAAPKSAPRSNAYAVYDQPEGVGHV